MNKQRYDHLLSHRKQIEAAFGGPLFRDLKDGRKQQYVRGNANVGGLDDEEKWEEIQIGLID